MNEPIYCSIDPVVFSIIDSQLHVLLFKRDKAPFKSIMALPGGLIQSGIDSSIDAAVDRVLQERTGVKINYREQVFSLGGLRDPRNWTLSVVYIALVLPQKITSNASWVCVSDVHEMKIAFDHQEIISKAVQRLTDKVNYSTLPMHFVDEEFTLPDLQKVYEIILEEKLDKSSFRKKMEESGLLIETGNMRKNGAFRPSKLYKVAPATLKNFDKNMV